MLHDINFIDWQSHQRGLKKRCLFSYGIGLLVMVLIIEFSVYLFWCHQSQLLAIRNKDYQASLLQSELLQRQVKKSQQLETNTRELEQAYQQWQVEKGVIYQFIHRLKSSINPLVSITSLTHSGTSIELDGQFLSRKKFNEFMALLDTASFIDVIDVEAVSTQQRQRLSGGATFLSDFRIQIQLASELHQQERSDE